jgi:hypothetical protein
VPGELDVERFRTDGYLVLRRAVDGPALAAEVDRALADGFAPSGAINRSDEAAIRFRYLPMMSERTPVSLGLVARFRGTAAALIGRDVLPVRAKAVEYHGGSTQHRDSDLRLASVGFACYLEPLTASTGALRVVPGSHLGDPADRAEVAVETEPGDVIVFDEHLLHASSGGTVRRQWRVDYLAAPSAPEEEEAVRRYFAAMFVVGWDGGYDLDRYPTYGPGWRRFCDPADDTALERLGAYAASEAEEAAARAGRASAAR